jgi:hypothetical protein
MKSPTAIPLGPLKSDIPRLRQRAKLLNSATHLALLSGMCTALLLVVGFASALFRLPHEYFGIALILLGCSIFRFGQKVRMGLGGWGLAALPLPSPCWCREFIEQLGGRSLALSYAVGPSSPSRYGLSSASSLARVQNWPLSVDFFARVYPAPLGCRFASRTQPLIRTRAPAAFHGKAGRAKSAAFS